jgi:uncharacterized protein
MLPPPAASHALQVIVDTNVLVSALLFPNSVPDVAVQRVLRRDRLLMSEALLQEIRAVVLRPKFRKYVRLQAAHRFLLRIARSTQMIAPTTSIEICRDPKDNMLLELAVDGKADYIVTGDSDLLTLHPFQGIAIVTPEQFLTVVDAKW